MVIAIDATPLVLSPLRGVARALDLLLQGLARTAPRPPVVLLSPMDLAPGTPRLDGVLWPDRPLSSVRAFRRALPALVRRAGADVLHVPWSAIPAVGIPVVATVHELPFVRHGPLEGRIRAFVHASWLRLDVRRAAAIVTPSRATREDLLSLHPGAARRVHVVPNGFDPRPWADAGQGEARASPPRLVLLGTGSSRRGPRKKGVDVLLAALSRLEVRPLDVVLVGDPRARLPPGIRAALDPEDLALRRLVASAAVLVHPARSEGFGYPLLEAMAAGVPVVASDAGAIPEVAGGAALLFPSGDAAALARALARVLGDPALASSLVSAGRRRAEAFSPEGTARGLLRVLQGVRSGEPT